MTRTPLATSKQALYEPAERFDHLARFAPADGIGRDGVPDGDAAILVISLATNPMRWLLRLRSSFEKPSSLEKLAHDIASSSVTRLPRDSMSFVITACRWWICRSRTAR